MINIPSHYNREQVRFFLLGFCYQAGVLYGTPLAEDEKTKTPKGHKWVTLDKGPHVLLDPHGKIVAGLGNKFNGMTVEELLASQSATPDEVPSTGKIYSLKAWGEDAAKVVEEGLRRCDELEQRGSFLNKSDYSKEAIKITKDLNKDVVVNFPDGDYRVTINRKFVSEIAKVCSDYYNDGYEAERQKYDLPRMPDRKLVDCLRMTFFLVGKTASTLSDPDVITDWGPAHHTHNADGLFCEFRKKFSPDLEVIVDIGKKKVGNIEVRNIKSVNSNKNRSFQIRTAKIEEGRKANGSMRATVVAEDAQEKTAMVVGVRFKIGKNKSALGWIK
ncbi:MAG: hypothetical protein SOR95_08355 [Sutterella sp.]|nr:hypothetical protein [Sutterella sp.]